MRHTDLGSVFKILECLIISISCIYPVSFGNVKLENVQQTIALFSYVLFLRYLYWRCETCGAYRQTQPFILPGSVNED